MNSASGQPLLAILGAGDSRRMGRPKLLLQTGGVPHLHKILETAREAGIQDYRVACQAAHLRALRGLGLPASRLHPVPETLRARGPIGSLASLLAAIRDAAIRDTHSSPGASPQLPGYAGLVVWPVDHPRVQVATVQALLVAPGNLRVPCHEGRGGHPVWVGAEHWERLLRLAEEGGTLRDLFHEKQAQVHRLEVDDPGILHNLNRPEDLG